MSFDAETLNTLCDAFSNLKHADGTIKGCDLQKAFEVLGLPIPGYEARELLEKDLHKAENVNLQDLYRVYEKVKAQKETFNKGKVLGSKAGETDLKVVTAEGRHEAKHTVSGGEALGYANWINKNLKNDPDCKQYLNIAAIDLYEKCKDGVILCKLINHSVPDTVDKRALNVGKDAVSLFKQNENRVLAVNSAAAIGVCVVNIGAGDIAEMREHLILGMLWQIIRIGLLKAINLAYHKELAVLLRDGETLDDLRQLTPEELLIRWVNYHLEKAGIDRRITNFKDDIMDSVAYAHLIKQICPADKRDQLIGVNTVLGKPNSIEKAEYVLKNADVLDAAVFVQAEDIAKANEKGKNFREKLNLAFVANLFNNYPALYLDEEIEIIEETLEEKTYRNWINSMPGNKVFVKDLYADLRNGLVLLVLFDELKPGCVEWPKVYKEFDPKKKLFQMQANCNQVVKCATECHLSIVNLGAEDLREGEKKLTLGLVFQMMKFYTLKLLMQLRGDGKRIDDADIIAWANEKLRSAAKSISGFRDPQIASGVVVLHLIDSIVPNSINFSEVTDDHLSNAKYAVSMARKVGARVYSLPEHLVELNKNMVMSMFACLMILDYKLQKNIA